MYKRQAEAFFLSLTFTLGAAGFICGMYGIETVSRAALGTGSRELISRDAQRGLFEMIRAAWLQTRRYAPFTAALYDLLDHLAGLIF